jgi:hypothetical protein
MIWGPDEVATFALVYAASGLMTATPFAHCLRLDSSL